METLIDDLKPAYQLKSGMLPVSREGKDLVRLLKEAAIAKRILKLHGAQFQSPVCRTGGSFILNFLAVKVN